MTIQAPMLLQLKVKILEKFKSQSDFVNSVNISDCRLSRIIRGRAKATKEERARICSALNCLDEEIFSNEQ